MEQDLLSRLLADKGANRALDAEVAVALYRDGDHADPRDNTTARLPCKTDECAVGTYWVSAFSGLSLRTAPDYTSDLTLKRLALDALGYERPLTGEEQAMIDTAWEAHKAAAPDMQCPHAGPFMYCPECLVSPCPIGLGTTPTKEPNHD